MNGGFNVALMPSINTYVTADRRFSNNSRRPSNWLYREFLIFTQVVSSGVYSPSRRLATMPSRS